MPIFHSFHMGMHSDEHIETWGDYRDFQGNLQTNQVPGLNLKTIFFELF